MFRSDRQRAALLISVVACALVLGACTGGSQRVTSEEIPLVTWYAEDVAHGIDRDPYDLIDEQASDGRLQIGAWALARIDGTAVTGHPAVLASRRGRWVILADGLRRGDLAINPRDGLLIVTPQGLTGQEPWAELVAQENLDRLQTARILLARGEIVATSDRARALLSAIREARLEHARLAGGNLWTSAPSESTSPNVPTTSISPAVPAPRRGP